MDDLIEEINNFQEAYIKEIKILHDRLDDINIQIDRTIKDEIRKAKNEILQSTIQANNRYDEVQTTISSELK